MKPLSVYIHIPYCTKKCPYCDFNTYAQKQVPEREYRDALLAELEVRLDRFPREEYLLETIYFGGGTPSLFQPEAIESVIDALCARFSSHQQLEITLEANPLDLNEERAEGFRAAGVNRISLGAQSFQSETLKILGRRHHGGDVQAALRAAHRAHFTNVSLDLIFGVPGQSIGTLEQDLIEIRGLELPHLSTYGLTIEKGTPFFQAVKEKTMVLPPEETVLEMMDLIRTEARELGLERYEVSNFARPGFEAKHNLAYWNHQAYLGLGAGAHSFQWTGECEGLRWANIAEPKQYIKKSRTHAGPNAWSEELGRYDLLFEEFFLGLRKASGVDLALLHSRYGMDPKKAYCVTIPLLMSEGQIAEKEGHLFITERGLPLADSIIESFVEVDQKLQLEAKGRLLL